MTKVSSPTRHDLQKIGLHLSALWKGVPTIHFKPFTKVFVDIKTVKKLLFFSQGQQKGTVSFINKGLKCTVVGKGQKRKSRKGGKFSVFIPFLPPKRISRSIKKWGHKNGKKSPTHTVVGWVLPFSFLVRRFVAEVRVADAPDLVVLCRRIEQKYSDSFMKRKEVGVFPRIKSLNDKRKRGKSKTIKYGCNSARYIVVPLADASSPWSASPLRTRPPPPSMSCHSRRRSLVSGWSLRTEIHNSTYCLFV